MHWEWGFPGRDQKFTQAGGFYFFADVSEWSDRKLTGKTTTVFINMGAYMVLVWHCETHLQHPL